MTSGVQSSASGRNNGIDAGRVVAALLVIAVHVDLKLTATNGWWVLGWEALCRSAVPFFFVASGYFALRATQSVKGTLAHIWQRVIPLMVVWNFIYFILQGPAREPWKVLVMGSSPGYHLWYFPSLMVCLLLLAGMRKIASPLVIVAMGLALYAFALAFRPYAPFVHLEGLTKIWNVRNGPFFGFVFVAVGYYIRVTGAPRLAAGAALLLLGALLQLGETVMLNHTLDQSPHGQEILLGTLFMGIGAFIVCVRAPDLAPIVWLARLGQVSLGVYAVHLLFLVPLTRLTRPDGTNPVHMLMLLLACFVLSLGTALALSRIPAFRRFVS